MNRKIQYSLQQMFMLYTILKNDIIVVTKILYNTGAISNALNNLRKTACQV